MFLFKKKVKLNHFALIISILNVVLYHFPFYKFVFTNIDFQGFNSILLAFSMIFLAILLNAILFYIILFLLRSFGKYLLVILFIVNSAAIYFVNTYGVILDKSMIGNIMNTNYEESASFFSFTLVLYVFFLGIIPSVLILKIKTTNIKLKKFSIEILLAFILLLLIVYINGPNWLWVDKNSKRLGGLLMPWSYVGNIGLFYKDVIQKNKKQILLPNATIKNNKKSVVILVIGESARRKNFSLYGYNKDTNPLLLKIKDLHVYKAQSVATYTTAAVKAILDYKKTNTLYEVLPNYLFRNGVNVIWRTTNWGEPEIKIKNYENKQYLAKLCKNNKEGIKCNYDEVLLYGLKNEILNSKKNKIFVVLHSSTSHGPAYSKKYPKRFSKFTPVCESVELDKCSKNELINAYDNTIVYTDYILYNLIEKLKQLKNYDTSLIYLSDHGESLGEKNLYMHGLPLSIAPKEQYQIPFIVWTSDKATKFRNIKKLSQYYVFHSVLDFLGINSPIYNKNMSIIEK